MNHRIYGGIYRGALVAVCTWILFHYEFAILSTFFTMVEVTRNVRIAYRLRHSVQSYVILYAIHYVEKAFVSWGIYTLGYRSDAARLAACTITAISTLRTGEYIDRTMREDHYDRVTVDECKTIIGMAQMRAEFAAHIPRLREAYRAQRRANRQARIDRLATSAAAHGTPDTISAVNSSSSSSARARNRHRKTTHKPSWAPNPERLERARLRKERKRHRRRA